MSVSASCVTISVSRCNYIYTDRLCPGAAGVFHSGALLRKGDRRHECRERNRMKEGEIERSERSESE